MSAQSGREQRALRGQVVRGVGWMMASQGSTQVLALLTSVVIARLLLPREVGLAAEAGVFGSLALVIADFGVASVIVQRRSLTETDMSTAFWATMIMGAALTALGVGLSWPIASLYGQQRVQGLFAVLSLSFLLTAPGIVQGALLTRELRFRQLEVRNIAATGAGCGTAMLLAALGFGPWAIVAQALAVAGASTVLLWRSSSWRPRLMFSWESLRSMAGFAGHTFGSRSLGWATLNMDNFLVGRFLGAAPLGAYSLACAVALSPLKRIAMPITQVFFPAFSRMEDSERIGGAWLRALRMVALIVVPATLGFVVIAREFVVVVFGHRWLAAVVPLQLLAPIGLLQALTALNSGILQATGQARTLFRCTVLVSAVSLAGFAVGLPWGIKGVSTAYLLASVVVQPYFLAVTARAVGLSLRDCAGSLSGLLQAGAGMVLALLAGRELLLSVDVPTVPRLVVLIAVGAVAYVALVAWRAPEVRQELRSAIERRRGSRGGSDAAPGPSGAHA
jgi:O-antigen/teichoic acid export membrane protein